MEERQKANEKRTKTAKEHPTDDEQANGATGRVLTASEHSEERREEEHPLPKEDSFPYSSPSLPFPFLPCPSAGSSPSASPHSFLFPFPF